MVVAKCISKNRNNRGAIVNYTLQDQTGQQKVVTGQQIKQAIKAGRIMITNLQIDKADRLIDKTENKITIPEKKNNINSKIKERQAEIFVNFIKSIKYDTHCEEFNIEDIQVKSEAAKKKILELCEKRFTDKKFSYNHAELVEQHRYGNRYFDVDWKKVYAIEKEVSFNEIFANYLYGNLAEISIKFADDWYGRHEYDLIMGGEYDLEEVEELIEEESNDNSYIYNEVKEVIKKYERQYNMFIQYNIEDGYITISRVEFR